ncbi:mitochondrial transcription rescue factor 1 [Apis florea]|uniref:mitochondrial transcription rescue factor 1 n=1 Tax=Apis florea TaxID=7463 RepID=UPI0012FE9233|nr:mitochondrial transcription rescue factor 1 [Apis florea]
MSRAKVDKEFYMSNIRLNGKKCFKKGIKVNLGDEIDFIQKRSPDNPNYLIINRCILLSIKTEPEEENFKIKLLQNKSLLIEEYQDKWHNKLYN